VTQIPEDARDLLDEPTFAHFATMLPNGMPHVTPTWVDADDNYEHVLVNTARTRRKERNVRGNPNVGLSILDSDDPYRYLSLWGEVVELTEEGARDHIDKLAQEYMGVETYPSYEDDPGPRVIIRIEPQHVTTNG
jgi:PPOX class probable F420-dependent enzyme